MAAIAVTEELKIDSKNSANKEVTADPEIPLSAAGYLTKVINEEPESVNEQAIYTRSENVPHPEKEVCVTDFDAEEYDLAPELNLDQAAEATRKFIEMLRDDIIDIDLGPDL